MRQVRPRRHAAAARAGSGRATRRKGGGAAVPVLPLLLLLGTSPVVYVMLRYETPDDAVAPPPAPAPKRPHLRPRAPAPARPDPRPNKQIADLAERARRDRERAKAEPVADGGLPPMYGGPSTKPKTLGLDRCAAFRSAQGPRGRPAVAGLFNTGTNFLMKLFRMNCDVPDACPAQPHIKVDKDNPYAAEIRIMAEMQLARRNHCSPFLLQVPWGKHNPVDWRGQHSAQGLEGVDVDGVLPVVVVKDPFTWMRSMCRARPVFFSSASAAFIIRAQAWSTRPNLDMGRCRLSVKNELQLDVVAAMASS